MVTAQNSAGIQLKMLSGEGSIRPRAHSIECALD
jgi:isocitrate dehydrogenase